MRVQQLQSAIQRIVQIEQELKNKTTNSIRLLAATKREMKLELVELQRGLTDGR